MIMIPLRFRCLLQANFKYLTKSFSTLVRLLGSSPIIYKYTKKMKKGDVAKLKTKQEEQGIQMVKRRMSKGKLKVTGCFGLTQSAAYPRKLCSETVKHFEDCVLTGSNDSQLMYEQLNPRLTCNVP